MMQHCTKDLRSLFNAARSHRKLHQAATLALSNVTSQVSTQQQLDSILHYLEQHGQHINSISLSGPECKKANSTPAIALRELPSNLPKLTGLKLCWLSLQLQPSDGHRGVLTAPAASTLKRLRLDSCSLLDGKEGLKAALTQLPAVQLLVVRNLTISGAGHVSFTWTRRLQQLQHLQHLGLLGHPGRGHNLQHLHKLTQLQSLQLRTQSQVTVDSKTLAGLQLLTRLELGCKEACKPTRFNPAALAGKTKLQDLELAACSLPIGTAGVAQLLSHLQQLTQLTRLCLGHSLNCPKDATPPAAAYSALTASSKLRRLDIRLCRLPAGVWQHIFQPGRQLPNLRVIMASCVEHPAADSFHPAPAPDGTLLASCCPGLRVLMMASLQYSAGQLAPLQGLSNLRSLTLQEPGASNVSSKLLAEVCQMTGLRNLLLGAREGGDADGQLLRLTQLQQLTRLKVGPIFGQQSSLEPGTSGAKPPESLKFVQGPGGEPVWRQLLERYLHHSDPEVAQQAAAGLVD